MTNALDKIRADVFQKEPSYIYVNAATDKLEVSIGAIDERGEVFGYDDAYVPLDFIRGVKEAFFEQKAWSDTSGNWIAPVGENYELIIIDELRRPIHIDVPKHQMETVVRGFCRSLDKPNTTYQVGGYLEPFMTIIDC